METKKTGRKKTPINIDVMAKEIKNNPKLVFISDLCAHFCIPYRTFMNRYPATTDEHKLIDSLLEMNRANMRAEIRDRLKECKNPSALIFLYKLITTNSEERKLLFDTYNETITKFDEGEDKVELKID